MMKAKATDWVGLVEAGYSLEDDDEAWLKHVLDHAASLSQRGFWPTIGTYRYTPRHLHLERIATLGPASATQILQASMTVKTAAVDQFFRGGATVTSLSEALYGIEPDLAAVVRQLSAGKVHDKLAVKGFTGQGSALMICWLFAQPVAPTRQERHRWRRAASHLGAGLRLRHMASRLTLEAAPVEGILDGSGKLYEARDGATRVSARAALRDAVRRLDHVRTREGRCDPDHALDAWEGLVAGRWSLVDHFDADGRRYVLALKNDPVHPDPRGLTLRERQVAEYCGMKRSAKEIAYILGLTNSAVGNALTRAQQKLGLRSRTELAALFSPRGMRARMAEMELKGERIAAGSYPIADTKRFAALTTAERDVAILLLQGATYDAVAQQRNCAERTIANQAQSIYRKLRVRSRVELAATMGTAESQ